MGKYSSNRERNCFITLFLKQNKQWLFKKGKRHNKLYSPKKRIFIVPCTPSCPHAYENFRHDLMRGLNNE